MNDWTIKDEFNLPKGAELRELTGTKFNPMMFEPPGPIGEAYVYGLEPIDYIMGPVGSGKTTCSIWKMPAFALRMPPCKDGVIRCRGVVTHENFRALYNTGLESIFQFFPKDFPGATFEGGQDRPFKFTIRFRTPKGRAIQLILDGMGIGEQEVETKMRGWQGNFGWNVEADLSPRKIAPFVYSRVVQGRYPGRANLAEFDAKIPASVWGDLNPPLISHPIFEDFVEKPREGYLLRRQPSGLSDQAENRKYASREGYEAMAKTLPADEVRRFVHGEFGLVGDGALVYPEYDFSIHCAKEPLQPLDLPLRLGADAGGSPAAILAQYTPKGHMRWLDELCTEPGTGIGRFCEYMIDLLQSKYRGLRIEFGWGDPSAFYGADRQRGELSFMETLGKALNINILPTMTNEPRARQESVAFFLRRRLDADGVPFFQHCPKMKAIQKGFQGGFVIELNPHDTAQGIRFRKNPVSHPHEAGQYVCYGSRGHAGMINDAARAGRPGAMPEPRPGARANSNFSMFD
jgi:hypothetical protein